MHGHHLHQRRQRLRRPPLGLRAQLDGGDGDGGAGHQDGQGDQRDAALRRLGGGIAPAGLRAADRRAGLRAPCRARWKDRRFVARRSSWLSRAPGAAFGGRYGVDGDGRRGRLRVALRRRGRGLPGSRRRGPGGGRRGRRGGRAAPPAARSGRPAPGAGSPGPRGTAPGRPGSAARRAAAPGATAPSPPPAPPSRSPRKRSLASARSTSAKAPRAGGDVARQRLTAARFGEVDGGGEAATLEDRLQQVGGQAPHREVLVAAGPGAAAWSGRPSR